MSILLPVRRNIENMENMSETVINCLQQGRFNDHQLSAFRGVTNSLHIFKDELHLKTFLSYTEEMKETSELTYKVNEVSSMLKDLSVIWNVNENYEGNYFEDYQSLNNSVPELIIGRRGEINTSQQFIELITNGKKNN